MPQLDQVPTEHNPTHLLLIGDTKMGKSTYAAQCALDGFKIIYIDSDNGLSAMMYEINRVNPAAMKNVMYYRTDHPAEFLKLFMESGIFRWNLTQDKMFSSGTAKPDDNMVEIIPSRIPRGILMVNDSWTSTALDAMEIGASNKKTELESMSESNLGEQVYGDAGMRLKLICAVIQQCKFNVLVLAHPTVYEIWEKPKGQAVEATKRKNMILLDTIRIPLSSSRPNGYEMGKYFTDIGWLEVDHANRRQLNFKIEYKRVGGGRPNKIGVLDDMQFKSLFGDPIDVEFSADWIREMTAEEWKLANGQKTAAPAGVTASGALVSTPAKPNLNMLMKK